MPEGPVFDHAFFFQPSNQTIGRYESGLYSSCQLFIIFNIGPIQYFFKVFTLEFDFTNTRNPELFGISVQVQFCLFVQRRNDFEVTQ